MSDYIKNRFDDQRDWYDAKAIYYKKLFYRSQWAVIILSGIAPILTLVGCLIDHKILVIAAGSLPTLVAAIISLQQFGRWQSLFLEYRTTSEMLKRQWYLFDGKIGDYDISDDKDRQKVFIHHVEDLISRQNRTWVESYKAGRFEELSS